MSSNVVSPRFCRLPGHFNEFEDVGLKRRVLLVETHSVCQQFNFAKSREPYSQINVLATASYTLVHIITQRLIFDGEELKNRCIK